ncbi:MAG: hypothetical protein K0S75_862 [Clostridia bacterium]|jgi:hypothetical protein|nr:hypothetical protein [Clostridia bacterium]
MIKDLLQNTLDTVLHPKGIHVHDQRKSGPEAHEYVVYSSAGDSSQEFADDIVLTKNASLTVRYYYRSSKLDNYTTRKKVREIEDIIENALIDAGFEIPPGRFDAGDVDDIGYCVTVFECEYWRGV